MKNMKRVVFTLFQPAMLALIVVFWAYAPASLLEKGWLVTAISICTLVVVQILEFVNERHPGWRLNWREFLTDVFYVVLYFAVIAKVETKLAEEPLLSAKHALGITTVENNPNFGVQLVSVYDPDYLGAPAYSMALYGKDGKPTYISIVFSNAATDAASFRIPRTWFGGAMTR